jgi:predicted acyltransferase
VNDETPEQPSPEPETVEEARARRRARSEAKDQAVRDSLEPLAPGERPLAVTIASVIAGLLAIGNILTYALSDHAANADRGKEIFQTFAICAILAAASWGMWRAKYWAVLGFQTILGLQILVLSLSILTASNALVALLFLAIILLSSVLFWFLIRAMARIQMPEAPDVKKLQEQREEAEQAARAQESEKSDG